MTIKTLLANDKVSLLVPSLVLLILECSGEIRLIVISKVHSNLDCRLVQVPVQPQDAQSLHLPAGQRPRQTVLEKAGHKAGPKRVIHAQLLQRGLHEADRVLLEVAALLRVGRLRLSHVGGVQRVGREVGRRQTRKGVEQPDGARATATAVTTEVAAARGILDGTLVRLTAATALLAVAIVAKATVTFTRVVTRGKAQFASGPQHCCSKGRYSPAPAAALGHIARHIP